jgi:hypothetical protein
MIMKDSPHAMAPHDLPGFLPGADGSDPLFTVVGVLLLAMALAVGNLYFKLHALPEHMAHKQNNTQLQFIAVLTLLALFTHNNVFWVTALLLAVVRLPDFSTPIQSIAASLETLAADKNALTLEGETPAGAEKKTPQSGMDG